MDAGSPIKGGKAVTMRYKSKVGCLAAALALACFLRGVAAQYDSCTNGTAASIGNGQCDAALNTASCGFDGGDCCPCTCSDGPDHSCANSDFSCLYPACDDSPSTTEEAPTCVEEWLGDGQCNQDQNIAACAYDGGDCCGCSCVDGPDYSCGVAGFICLDPACFDPALVAEFPDCTGKWGNIGDGYCNPENNVPSCGYDGGDCCLCSCTGSACGRSVFDCLDPDASDEFYECGAPPPASPPCSVGAQQLWVVDDSAQAQALAAAVNCSGGSFEVEWRGSVVVDEPIYVGGGTSLTISGADRSTAAIDGNSSTRLFTVVNAALHLTNVNVSYGASTAGGAIAATESTLSFNRTNFIGNSASGNGGAVFASGESSVSCYDGTTFVENTAGVDGGALFIGGGSVASCGATWLSNTAAIRGGAVRVQDESSLSWSEESTFGSNVAGSLGGVLSLLNASIVSWNAPTVFYSNSAGVYGGVLSASDNCDISWNAGTGFYFNAAGLGGGAVFARDETRVSWSGDTNTVFDGNQAGGMEGGGGMLVSANAHAVCTQDTTSTFSGNLAPSGGAVSVMYASVSFGGTSTFEGNVAFMDPHDTNTSANGGALSAFFSSASFTGAVNFTGNVARQGGALYMNEASVLGNAPATFLFNNASGYGGALYMYSSNIAWNGQTTMASNWATDYAGALYASNSIATWDGEVLFTKNKAGSEDTAGANGSGGALVLYNSSFVWDAHTTMEFNSADKGGAVYLTTEANMTWNGNAEFVNNSAMSNGGAVSVVLNSTATWYGDATFAENNGNVTSGFGGAVGVWHGSSVVWSGGFTKFERNEARWGSALAVLFGASASWDGLGMEFVDNSAEWGGALYASASEVSWSGETAFRTNSATLLGGALYASASEVSWSGETAFRGNVALIGGAVFLTNGSYVGWTGETVFASNEATTADGGAVASPAWDSAFNLQESTLQIGATTTFSNNTSGANGGAVALLGACSLVVDPGVGVSYIGNSADIAGGAVFVSGAGAGPVFNKTSFDSNRAQVGGAVSIFGSGAEKNVEDVEPPNPTKFHRCEFVGNRAIATGGAIDTAAGWDWVTDSSFEDNVAGTGGALRLAGTAAIDRCSFVENFSDDEQGAVVSNIGFLHRVANTSFRGNGFTCPTAMFLDFNTSGDPYDAVCDGCQPDCDGCVFAEPHLAPMCSDVLEHSTSPGGVATLESLSIQAGYWRATASSRDVFECYHADACRGGVTGTADFCREGYEGPYCSICSEGYSAQIGFVCTKCSNNTGGIVLAAIVAVVALVVAIAVISYVTTGEGRGSKRRFVNRVAQFIPLQSIKIIVVVWQILTQFTAVANVTYPGVYETFLDGLDVFNFDLTWVLSAGCVFDVDFHDRLLMSTIGPIIAAAVLGCTYAASTRIHREAPETLHQIRHKHVSMLLLLTFFVYASVSSVLFRAFACEVLADGVNYLRSDYRIECDSAKHRGFQVYAGLMMLLYTVGVPAFYSFLLYKDREVLQREDRSSSSSRVSSTSDLWKPYKPSVFYYEVVECVRRIMLAGVVVFIYPNSSAQIAITIMIAFAFVLVSEGLAPYASRWDHWISRTGHVVVIVSMYLALLLKVDASDERSSSQKVFEAALIAVHVVMVFVVLVETVVLALGLRAQHREDSWPRVRGSGKIASRAKEGGGEEAAYWDSHNPFADHVQETKNAKPAEAALDVGEEST